MAVAEKPPRVNTSHARRAHSSQRFSSRILADDLENLVCGQTHLNPFVEDNIDEYIYIFEMSYHDKILRRDI